MDVHQLKAKVLQLLKKRELNYNQQQLCPYPDITFDDHIIIVNNNDAFQDKKAAVELEKSLYNNNKNYILKITNIQSFWTRPNLITHYTLEYYKALKPEYQQLLQKIAIPKIDMEQLLHDLQHGGIQIYPLLQQLKTNNLTTILNYFSKNDIEVSKLMPILYKNKVTVQHLLQNPFIRDLIKQSNSSWIIGHQHLGVQDECPKIYFGESLVKKVNVTSIIKVKKDQWYLIHNHVGG